MSALPSGTVTFLFTDIEGSTTLLKALGRDRYDRVLAEHGRLLRAAFAAHEGRVVDTQGDSFFVAFRTAADAVSAAVDAQRDLAAGHWPEGAEVTVRMGLHTGEPKVGEERYVGIGVHRAARIGAAGHGGQVLLSSTTKELAEEELPPGVSIRDLGVRRLKDIDQPQRLFQLNVEGLRSEFAQLRTLDVELRRKRRRMYAGSALIGVLAAAVAIPIFAFGQGGSGGRLTVEGNAVVEIDPHTNKVVGQVPVGTRPASISYGSGSLWVANLDDQTVSRIDPATRSVKRNLPVEDTPTGLATSPGAVWVVGSNATRPSVTVRRIDPQFDSVSSTTRIGNVVPGGPGSVAARGSTVWAAPSSGLLSRLHPRSAQVLQRIDPNAGMTAVAVGPDAVWITDSTEAANTVVRIDPTGLATPIAVGHGPSGIAVGAGAVWVADSLDDSVVRIDPATRAVTTTVPVGGSPVGIAVGEGSVWVANSRDGTVTRIDATTATPIETIKVGGSPQAVAVANGHVWVTVQPAVRELQVPSPGGTARIKAENDVDSMDPALAFETKAWQLLYATCAKLLNYPDKPAPAGSQLEPEVARSLPERSADGKTYTFTIREGFRFSPPSNEPVTARTFKYAIERSLSPRMKGPALLTGYLSGVVGAKAYMAGKAQHISGIVARGNRLIVRLVTPAPDFVTLIALPWFCAVPIGTPFDPKGVRLVPSAGPYYVASYTPGQGVVLKRNPNYHGSRPHRLEQIELAVGSSKEKAVREIEAEDADYAADGIAPALAPRLAARYGPGSEAAKKGRQQYFLNASPEVDFIFLNTHRPLFSDVRLRRAVNYAIDRRSLARLGNPFVPYPQRPTDQYLPPGMPGFTDVQIYPLTPDTATAKRLAGGKPRSAVLYTCNVSPCDQLAQIVKANLAAIGIDLQVKTFPFRAMFGRLSKKGEPFDMAAIGWLADYPDPSQFLNLLLLSGIIPTLDDPAYKRKLAAAARLSGPARYLAYGKLDADLARNAAPWVAYANSTSRDFFSARMGCQVFQPIYGMDLAALCLRR
ncbi:MAG: ABC transporter substrate-binding protein [Actinomycetota bacterium]